MTIVVSYIRGPFCFTKVPRDSSPRWVCDVQGECADEQGDIASLWRATDWLTCLSSELSDRNEPGEDCAHAS